MAPCSTKAHVSPAALLVFVLIAAFALPCLAQVACDAGPYSERLPRRYNDDCRKENPELLQRLEIVTKGFYGVDVARTNWDNAAIALLRNQAFSVPDAQSRPANASKLLDDIRANLSSAASALEAGDRKNNALKIDYWEHIGPGSPGNRYLVDTACADKTEQTPSCADRYKLAADLSDRIFLARNIVAMWLKPDAVRFRDQVTARGARWESYLYDAQFQYWWELWLNRTLEEACPSGPNGFMGRLLVGEDCQPVERDKAGNLIRWREPPRYHAVALHPDIGLQYNGNEPNGQRLKPTLVFQWFGYQWWEWENNKVSKLRGAAIVSTVSDNATQRAVGIGVQAQVNEYLLAVTSHGGKPTFTLSMNLADRLSKLNDAWANKLKRP